MSATGVTDCCVSPVEEIWGLNVYTPRQSVPLNAEPPLPPHTFPSLSHLTSQQPWNYNTPRGKVFHHAGTLPGLFSFMSHLLVIVFWSSQTLGLVPISWHLSDSVVNSFYQNFILISGNFFFVPETSCNLIKDSSDSQIKINLFYLWWAAAVAHPCVSTGNADDAIEIDLNGNSFTWLVDMLIGSLA